MPHLWTSEMIARFRELHKKHDASFTTIAAELSREFGIELTRNACIGKAHRLELPMRFRPHSTRKALVQPKPKVIKMKPVKPDAPIPFIPAPREPIPFTASIYDLEQGICHWPSGALYDKPPFFYCGEAAVLGRPYCDKHMKRAVSHWVKAS